MFLSPAILLALVALQDPATQPVEAAAGVKLTLESLDGKAVDRRVSRMVTLAVPEGRTASANLTPGRSRATFDGFINLKIRGDYTFSAQGRGELELLVNGQSILKTAGDDLSIHSSHRVRLKKGANSLSVRYTAPQKGDALLRLHWAERDRPSQPIAPTVLTHDAHDPALRDSLEIRAGRELFAWYRCAKCHAADGIDPRNAESMPEMHMDSPALVGIGSRLRAEWLARWIANPHSIRKDATMPRLFDSNQNPDPRAVDIAAYLATLGTPDAPAQFAPDDAGHGGRLYVGLGCIACHSFEPDPSDERTSLSHVKQKWHAAALVEYLKNPHRGYAWSRMPDFRLSDDEARRLSAFILSKCSDSHDSSVELPQANIERGRELVRTSGCLNCHELEGKSSLEAPNLDRIRSGDLNRGCLAEHATKRGSAPAFALDAQQVAQLRALLRNAHQFAQHDTADDFAQRHMRRMQCQACHDLDGQPDRWSRLRDELDAIEKTLPPRQEELRGDQARPSLTWAGEKLRLQWMTPFIAGQIDMKPRPWLEARMPAFPVQATKLVEGLSLQHGFIPNLVPDKPNVDPDNPNLDPDHPLDDAEHPINPDLAAIGRRLVGRQGGFACNTCHAVGPAAAISPFEAHGPNLMHTTARFRKEFYHRWVGDPQRYEPGTRMPQYSDAKGKTALRDTLDGDARNQFEAIWQYLRHGERIEPPE